MQDHPHVQAALLCENVIRGDDGAYSVIRIIDTFWIEPLPDGMPPGAKRAIALSLFVCLKAGPVKGTHRLRVPLILPSGKRKNDDKTWDVDFLGDVNGVVLHSEITLAVEEFGLYWFDVIWDEDLTVLTRIPMRILQGPPPGRASDESARPEPESRS